MNLRVTYWKNKSFWLTLIAMAYLNLLYAQSSVFTDLRNDRARATESFENENYPRALSILQDLEMKGVTDPPVFLMMARSHKRLNDPLQAARYYMKYEEKDPSIEDEMQIELAYAYMQGGYYDKALEKFMDYSENHPEDESILTFIWRLKNLQYLFDDSIYYEVGPLAINTEANESGATWYRDGIVFLSDRRGFGGIKKLDKTTHRPFMKWYYSHPYYDSLLGGLERYSQPAEFADEIESKFNKGNLFFYNDFQDMVFTRNHVIQGKSGLKPLYLLFASLENKKWKEYPTFPYNGEQYSITQPMLWESEEVLFFASDMPGGYGGMDLYYCEKISDKWSEPVNLGGKINTPYNEGHPFVHGNFLYFSSDGHPGMGGLDIFKVYLDEDILYEVENPGYPLNSNFDDFGLILNKEGNRGFFTSNRNDADNDDIFFLKTILQSYPLTINGTVRLRDISSNIDTLYSLAGADLYLIDQKLNVEAYHTVIDEEGTFSINIPYYSQYQLKITNNELGSAVVGLDIPRIRNQNTHYDVVVVKELFQFD